LAENKTGYVTVQIYDQTYHLSGQDPAHIRALAELVDARMRAVAAQGRTVDSLRVAVLAALNLADELSQAAKPAAPTCARAMPARPACAACSTRCSKRSVGPGREPGGWPNLPRPVPGVFRPAVLGCGFPKAAA